MTNKIDRKLEIETLISKGKTMKQIAYSLGISIPRVYQLLTDYQIPTLAQRQPGFWKQQTKPHRWLWRILCSKKLPRETSWDIFVKLKDSLPKTCPILGVPLSWDDYTLRDHCPSVDRIDSTKGYTPENVHIISLRANRIKNDGTAEELRKIADYLDSINK